MIRTLAIVTLATMPVAALAADGPTLYKRCAACHLASGAGVPGAFPPLGADFVTLAGKPAGRRYLVLAVTRGISGPIMVAGKPYRGIMPAQSMDDADTATVLNHVGAVIAKAGGRFKAFTAAEVKTARASGASLSPTQVGALHAAVGGK